MNPIIHPGGNFTYKAPEGMEASCLDLHVFKGEEFTESLWEPEEVEIRAIMQGAPVAMRIYGAGHPVVSLHGTVPGEGHVKGHRIAGAIIMLEKLMAEGPKPHLSTREQIAVILHAVYGSK
jgi:hypothetical protein